jgi:hypothetical protein
LINWLSSGLKPFVRGQVDGHVSTDLNRLEIRNFDSKWIHGTTSPPNILVFLKFNHTFESMDTTLYFFKNFQEGGVI